MRIKNTKEATSKNFTTRSFSLPLSTVDFIDSRSAAVRSASDYIRRLVEYDRRHNTLAASLQQDASELTAA